MASSRILSLPRLLATATATAAAKSSTLITRSLSTATTTTAKTLPRFPLLNNLTRLRPISAIYLPSPTHPLLSSLRTFATRNAYQDNQGSRPPKETILLDGCDFEHWLVVVEKPPQEWTRDEIIDHYIKTLAKVVGSEDEARMKIYSVSTRHYFAFGALVSEELSYKLKELEGVRWVLPDSYLDVKNKDYGGEPFINGVAVPYDPKYHEEWVRNNQKAMERNRRNDRPRNADRSRNFDRRQQRPQGYQNNPPLPAANAERPGGNMGGMPNQPANVPGNPGYGQNVPPGNPGYGQNIPPNNAGYGQNVPPANPGYRQNIPPNNAGYGQNMPPSNPNYGQNMPPNHAGYGQNPGFARNMPPSNMGGAPPSYGGQGNLGVPPMYSGQGNTGAPPNYGGQGNTGYPNNAMPNQQAGGEIQYQNAQRGHQQNYAPPQSNVGGQPGGTFQNQDVPGRDVPNY